MAGSARIREPIGLWGSRLADPQLPGIPHWAIKRALIDGYLPGADYTHYQDGYRYRQLVLASEIRGQGALGKIANFIRITVENKNATARKTRVTVVTGCHLGYPNRPITRVGWRYDAKTGRILDARGNLVLMVSAGGHYRESPAERTITYELTLKAGEKRCLDVWQPLFRCAGGDSEALASTTFEAALTHFPEKLEHLAGFRNEDPPPRGQRTAPTGPV